MKNKLNSSPRQTFNRPVVLVLLVCILTATFGTYKTSAGQQAEAVVLANANAAVANAQNELVLAQGKKLEAERRLEELEEFSTFKEPDASSLISMQRLTVTVGNLFNPGAEKPKLQDQLKETQTRVGAATKKLDAAKKDLESATTSPKIEAAKTAVQQKLDDAAAITPELPILATKLDTALAAIYGRVANLATAADNGLKPFTQPPTDAPAIRSLFQKLGDVATMMQFQVDLKERWEQLSAKLQNVVADHATKTEPVSTLNKLKQSVDTVAQNISTSITTLATLAQTRNDELFVKSEEFKKDPARQESTAIEGIREAQRLAEALEKVNRAAESISSQAESLGIAGFDKTKVDTARQALTTNVNQLKRQAAAFQELLSGDRSLWVTEKIRLYYFTDIPRLIQTLNPEARLTGGDVDGRRRADERLQKLRAAEDAQSEANGAVLALKKRVTTIRQELEQADLDLNAAQILAQRATARNAELERRPADSVPAERKARVLEDKNNRDQELAAAQERANNLNDQSNGLAAQLREAEAQLEMAQAAFERASSATIRAAQVESAAFANARDNAAFWFAPGVSTTTDPARRVDITSSTNGENAIFVRGRREDIVKVQDIVAKLDEPAPQARMTLWKIELNSDATQKGDERFNKAFPLVEGELANTREKIANALSRLLGAVSQEAEQAAVAQRDLEMQRKAAYGADYEIGHRLDCEERERYSRHKFPLDPANTDVTGRQQRLRRYSLYSPQVRKELGIEFIDELGFDNPKQFGLKDPASATTLNEALIIMLLTDRVHRSNIMANFEKALRQDLNQYAADDKERRELEKKKGVYFRRLRSMLGIDSERVGDNDLETTRQQQELIYAMRGPLVRHLIGRIVGLQKRVGVFLELNPAARSTLYTCLQQKLPKIFDTIHDEFPISPVDVMDGNLKLVDTGEGTIGLELPNGTRVYNLRPSAARVAAADGMLDVFTKAFEDDIDREFIQPMLGDLRTTLRKTGIGFGVIQRTSVLATNRLVARVDPRATAELSVGQETNLLQSLQSISQITLAAQTGNFLGALGQLRASANEKDTAEIFGITSGSAFQVTPIFDPTGQALRFKFDFVDTTLVREPRGTTNPRLPRVERHTVNTEVQLANLEIREVSRFESNAKVGLPTTYRGGLPILKDIPGLRPIPLIGWFIRRKGSNAIAQRSLIFAQTTMSPTIGDILDLFDTSLQRR